MKNRVQHPRRSLWKGFWTRQYPKALAWILVIAFSTPMFCTFFTYAADVPEGRLCPHHPEHTPECGYVAAVNASPCTHVHDETCGGLAASDPSKPLDTPDVPESPDTPDVPDVPESPDTPDVPDVPESPDTPDVPESPDIPDEPVAMAETAELSGCTHVHDETCGYAEAQEGSPCTFLCDKCVTSWAWVDDDEWLIWNEQTQVWGLGIPGTSQENPVTLAMLDELLPVQIRAETPAGTQSFGVTWDYGTFPEAEVWSGTYLLSALLTDRDVILTDGAPGLTVLVALGDGEMYAPDKVLNRCEFIARTGTTLQRDENGMWFIHVNVQNGVSQQQLSDLVKQALPEQVRGYGWTATNVDGFTYEGRDDDGANGAGPHKGVLNITWEIPVNIASVDQLVLTPKGNSTLIWEINQGIGVENGALQITVILAKYDLKDHIVPSASPENVTVNLFDYWVKEKNPTVNTGGDILTKSDRHYHEEGGEGALSTTSTGYSTEQDWNLGINKNHLLLFGDGLIHAGLWNKGAGENCRYGKQYAGMENIVKNVLNEAGYPELSLDLAKKILRDDNTRDYTLIKDYKLTGTPNEVVKQDGDGGYTYNSDNIQNLSDTVIRTWGGDLETSTESLQYLFDPTMSNAYKTSYTDVTGLFQLDGEGYYYYNMRKNFAEFSQEGGKNHFILYDAPATTRTDGDNSIGNFFPFNTGSEVFNGLDSNGNLTSSVSCSRNTMNHHLGMTVEVDFRQPAGGKVGSGTSAKPMTFGFSGDDDVWVFIDDVLVLDLGGVHSEIYGTIDFSTGDVYIGRAFGVNGIPANPADKSIMVTHTTLRDLYTAAEKETATEWNGNTYASNTSHTLKMFYLERGNYDSSIALRFNLQPLLYQRIEKVDQDGQPVPGVTFELYPAEVTTSNDANAIQCLYTDASINSGKTFYVCQTVEEDGSTGPLVTLTTDKDGSATFKTGSGETDYFNFADRGDAYYILRETKAPDGYRKQPIDIVLHYDSSSTMLTVANRWTTGAYACSISNITSGGTLNYGKVGADGTITPDKTQVVQPTTQEDGLVVAVPMLKKRSDNSWMALYGGNMNGFQSISAGSDETALLSAVLQAAWNQSKLSQKDGDTQQLTSHAVSPWYLNWDKNNKRLYGTLSDLPGLADRYQLNNPEHGDMRMVYAIIPAGALEKVDINEDTPEKRYQALGQLTEDKLQSILDSGIRFLSVEQFVRSFRSLIYIPNERRELWVMKVDQDGTPLPGAEFTLCSDKNCTEYVASGKTDGYGMLIFSPTGNDGTPGQAKMAWAESTNTQYYLKETTPPTGHQLNTTVIPVVVGTYSIYADAGTADNDVKVMAGVGRLTQTMRQFAMGNDVDITLQDITAFMQTQPSGSFNTTGWTDAKLAGTNVTRSMNLHFGKNAKVDYGLHDEDGGQNLFPYFVTETGFIRTRVQQNQDTSRYETQSSDVNKDNLGDTDLTNLFSLLNIVVVTDRSTSTPTPETGTLTIRKQLSGSGLTEADYTKNFTFAIELRDQDGKPLSGSYEYFFYGKDKAGFIDNQHNNLLLHHDDSVTILGLPVGTRVTVTEKSESGWHLVSGSNPFTGTVGTDTELTAAFVNSKDTPKPEDPNNPPTDPDPDPKDPPKDPDPDPKDPPKDPDPEDPKEPPKDPDPETPPTDPEDPPETPENPDYPTELPDPNDPNSPDEITIWEDGVPKTYIKVWDPENEEWIYVLDEDVPLWNQTPQTGDESMTGLWQLLSVLSLAGIIALIVQPLRKRRNNKR